LMPLHPLERDRHQLPQFLQARAGRWGRHTHPPRNVVSAGMMLS
jgi:hypothetical protein